MCYKFMLCLEKHKKIINHAVMEGIMVNRRWRGNLLLFLTALIWGAAFVAQKIGIVAINAFTFSASRFIISGIALLPVIMLNGKKREILSNHNSKKDRKILIIGGILCGIFLALATNTQQMGLMYTTAGKSGFITALYIVFVPLLSIFLGKKVSSRVWISVAAAVIGLYLLSVNEGFTVNKGDILVLVCAILFSLHILVIDKYSPQTDCVKMSCIQFFTASVFSAILMFIFEKPSLAAILSCWAPILYLGIVSGAIGYTLQIIGQKNTDPATASLIMSLETVFAAIMGVLFINESFSAKELAGCALVFGATILSQLNIRKKIYSRRDKQNNNQTI